MSKTKLTDKQVLHYINYVLGGDSYIENESKGDTVKAEKLKAEVQATGTVKAQFEEVAALIVGTISRYMMPKFTVLDEETLMLEELLKQNVPSIKKLNHLAKVLYDNGDISEDSYKYIKGQDLAVVHKDFVKAADTVQKRHDKTKEKLIKASKTQQDSKQTVAKTTFNSDSGSNTINLNAHRD